MHVLFLCPHGAAKSVIATAMLRDLASRDDLSVTVSNAGTEPDNELNPIALTALQARGLVYDDAPRHVTQADINGADVVVSFGCTKDELPAAPRSWVDWSDVPDASADVDGLIELLQERLPLLLSPG